MSPAKALVDVFKQLAPSPIDGMVIDAAWAEMRKDNLNENDMCRRLTGALYDGLAYGNWPSALAKLREKQ